MTKKSATKTATKRRATTTKAPASARRRRVGGAAVPQSSHRVERQKQAGVWLAYVARLERLHASTLRLARKDTGFESVASIIAALIRIMRAYVAGTARGMMCDLTWSKGNDEARYYGQRLELRVSQETSELTADERKTILDIEEARDIRRHRKWQGQVRENYAHATSATPRTTARRYRTTMEHAHAMTDVQRAEEALAAAKQRLAEARATDEKAWEGSRPQQTARPVGPDETAAAEVAS